MTFIIVASFQNEEDFGGDPWGYYVESDGSIVQKYGDDYHDDGLSKCLGFITGISFVGDEPEIKYEERADYEEIYK